MIDLSARNILDLPLCPPTEGEKESARRYVQRFVRDGAEEMFEMLGIAQ